VSRTIARWPCAGIVEAASSSASPMAVPPLGGGMRSRASRTASRSLVGASSTLAPVENVTTPMRVPLGAAATNARAAACAAADRVGARSSARIEPEVSMQITTVASCEGTREKNRGPPIAIASAAPETRNPASRSRPGTRDARSAAAAKARFE